MCVLGNPVLVLGLLWQIIRIQLMGLISLKNVPELVLLLQEGESMASFMKLNPEVILMRWLNYHLRKANSKRVAKNFTTDLMVKIAQHSYFIALHQQPLFANLLIW